MDFIIDGLLEFFSEKFSALLASKPLSFIERHIKNKLLCDIVRILVLLLCIVFGTAVAIGSIIGIVAIFIIYFGK